MTYETRVTQMTVVPKTEPLLSEMATEVTIVDQAGGEYVEVKQQGRTDLGKIAINPEEWPMLKRAIDTLIAECREVK